MRFLVGLMMITVILAGCTDDGAYVPDAADPCLVQSADDYSCDELPVGNPDEVAHIHDYWQGQERMTILEYSEAANPTSGGLIDSCDGWAEYVMLPADGFSVIQGTQFVEITMDWGDEPYDLYREPELWVKTASMDQPQFVQEVTPGETVIFESTNDHNDLPHSLMSAWQFIWYVYPEENAPDCFISHRSEFSISVDIVKGLDIPLFPAHPDKWDGGNITEMEVLFEDSTMFYSQGESGTCYNVQESDRCLWDPWLLNDGSIIPYDTDNIIVHLDVQPNDGVPFTVDFGYHGADTRTNTYLEPTRTEGTLRIYEIDVQRIQADGPYALQSLWEFWIHPGGETQAYSGAIQLKVTAFKDAD